LPWEYFEGKCSREEEPTEFSSNDLQTAAALIIRKCYVLSKFLDEIELKK
jgi:hypothetical protein